MSKSFSMSTVNFNSPVALTSPAARGEDAATERERLQAERVAVEFEALLLKQLTSSLNPSSDDEDADMFRSDGNDMYRNIFSEQLAQNIAKNGGIGIADLLVGKMLAKNAATARHRSEETPANLVSGVSPVSDVNAVNVETKAHSIKDINVNSVVRALRAEADLHGAAPRLSETNLADASGIPPAASSDTSSDAQPSASILNATRPRRVFAADSPAHAPEDAPHSLSFPSAETTVLQMPLAGRITSGFGYRRHPILGLHKHHDGVDIAAPRGTPIGAAAAGTVRFAGRKGGYGNTVIIEHPDGRTTRYAHAERLLVAEGDRVESGQTIATVGSTGHSTGPHLHFEVVENNHRTDPLKAIINDSKAVANASPFRRR